MLLSVYLTGDTQLPHSNSPTSGQISAVFCFLSVFKPLQKVEVSIPMDQLSFYRAENKNSDLNICQTMVHHFAPRTITKHYLRYSSRNFSGLWEGHKFCLSTHQPFNAEKGHTYIYLLYNLHCLSPSSHLV